MGVIWDQYDIQDMMDEFGVDCLYYQARLSPELKNSVSPLDTAAIRGFIYASPQAVRVQRTSISYKIISQPEGRLYQGGARFTIPATALDGNGVFQPVPMYTTLFKGDVIVVKDKPVRDYDVLTKGKRDRLYAFDVITILSVASVDTAKVEHLYTYGTDYELQVNGTPLTGIVKPDGSVGIVLTADMPIVSDITFAWLDGGAAPPDEADYNVEFICSPNYIVWDDMAKARGTHDNDLPKMIMTVKRAYVSKVANPVDQVPTTDDTLFDSFDQHKDSLL